MIKMLFMLLTIAATVLFATASGQEFEDEDADVHIDPKGVVVPLNQYTFGGNVINSKLADHWIVSFCVDWYPPCQGIQRPYATLGNHYDAKLNNDTLFSSVVRFAEVNCATDKWLCNEQFVDDYPMVAHYQGGEHVALWTGDGGSPKKEMESLSKWMEEELRHARNDHLKASSTSAVSTEDYTFLRDIAHIAALVFPIVSMSILVIHNSAELWQMRTRFFSPADTGKLPLSPKPEVVTRRMVHNLPREWATERCKIVL